MKSIGLLTITMLKCYRSFTNSFSLCYNDLLTKASNLCMNGFQYLGTGTMFAHLEKKNPLKKCLTTCLKERFVGQVKDVFWTLPIRSKLMQTSFTKILLKILPPENAIKNLYTELKGIKLLFSSKSGIFGVFIDVWYKHDLKEGCCMQLAFFCVSRPVWNKFTFDKSKM